MQQIPEIQYDAQTTIFEGSVNDIILLIDCLRGTRAAFLVVSTNDNIPGCHMAQDTAIGVINALKIIKQVAEDDIAIPKLVLLSSSSLDDQFSLHTSRLLHWIALRSASNIYQDLQVAEQVLRNESHWLETVFVKPGTLSQDVAHGYSLSLTEARGPLSYTDLAAAMVETVNDLDGVYSMQNVGILSLKGAPSFPRRTILTLLLGLLRHYLPFSHPYLPQTG